MKKNLLIAQSGGPSAVINASLVGIIKKALSSKGKKTFNKVYGGINGIEGILDRKIIDISKQLQKADKVTFETFKRTPAMALGTCRYKLPKTVNKDYKNLFKILKEFNVGYFIYIGGNDSMDTVNRLHEYSIKNKEDILFVGVPKTIDNDLNVTDHSPGFGSAAKYVASSIINTYLDSSSYSQKSVTIVEIMGRNAGWLTAASVLARKIKSLNNAPHLIYLPEVAFDEKEFIKKIDELTDKINTVIVAVSEGIKNKKGKYILESNRGTNDKFGHAVLGGVSKRLESLILEKLSEKKLKTRSIELNVLQRVGSNTISRTDMNEAFESGEKGCEYLMNGQSGVMPIYIRKDSSKYKIKIVPEKIEKVANIEKKVPKSFISKNKIDVTSKMVEYLSPLIKGQTAFYNDEGTVSVFSFDKEDFVNPNDNG